MTEEIQIFNFEEKQVRTIEINGEPWFVGKDVALEKPKSQTLMLQLQK